MSDKAHTGHWSGRPLLVSRLRQILRREFGATDAWVVSTRGRCRLEVRLGWRVIVLLDDEEHAFWAPFYTTAVRNMFRGGQIVPVVAPTQRRRLELTETLRRACANAGLAPRLEAVR